MPSAHRILRHYAIPSSVRRLPSTAMAVLGVALVVYVFLLVASLAAGVERTLRSGASLRRLVVLRPGSTTDVQSFIERESQRSLATLAELADGRARLSPELVLLVSQRRRDDRRANIVVRGVTPAAFEMIDQLEITEGRSFHPGSDEAIVARRMSERFSGLGLGETFQAGSQRWEIVGIFEAADSPFDSELGVDLAGAQAQSGREGFVSIVRVEAASESAIEGIQRGIAKDRRFALKATRETDYYAEQLVTASPIRVLAYLVALLMAIGASFGAMNTMYGQVSSRTRELATLRALGFTGGEVFTAVLAESVLFSGLGATVGCGMAYLTVATLLAEGTGTQNFLTFAEITVNFRISGGLALGALALGLAVGIGGGLHPSIRAARIRVSDGLRET